MQAFLKNNNTTIVLTNKPFAGGGEGDLFRILSPVKFQNYAVKIYHKNKRTAKQEQKIKYLVNNPPNLFSEDYHNSVIWPADLVYMGENFMGFIMPFAKGEKLELLCTQKLPKKVSSQWKRFSFKSKEAFELRLKVCYNIAAAIFQIHSTKKYVLVDLKPDNIIIQPNGLIALVDIDSVEVLKGSEVLFPSKVATPEFSPPEYYRNVRPGEVPIFETWDRFSMAVIFYKLMFGIHPFAGTSLPPYDQYVALANKIEHGLFIHSPSKSDTFKIVPPPHKGFEKISVHLQNLFLRCFEAGHENDLVRPSANEWCWSLTPKHPLAVERKLPSSVVPITQIEYSQPLSLAPVSMQSKTSLQPFRNAGVQYIPIQKSFLFTRTFAALTILGIISWLVFAPIPFSWMTFYQIVSLLVTNLMIGVIEYYSLPGVNEKAKALAEKYEISKKRIAYRKMVKDLKTTASTALQGYKEANVAFQRQQQLLLNKEREQIMILTSQYHTFLKEQNKRALQYGEEELKRLQQEEQKLLGEYADNELVKEISFIPINQRIKWLESEVDRKQQRIEEEARRKIAVKQKELNNIGLIVRRELVSERLDKLAQLETNTTTWTNEAMEQKKQLIKSYWEQKRHLLGGYELDKHLKEVLGNLGARNIIRRFGEKGMYSLGDFDIDESGAVETEDGNHFFIRGLDKHRLEKVQNWKVYVESKIPNFPSYKEQIKRIDTNLDKKIKKIKRTIELKHKDNLRNFPVIVVNRRHEILQDIESIKNSRIEIKTELAKSKKPIKNVIERTINEFDSIKEKVVADYNKKHDAIYEECENKKDVIATKIINLQQSTTKKISNLFNDALSQRSTDIQAARDLIQTLEDKNNTLHQLNQDFIEKSKEVLRYKKITLGNYLKMVYTFRKP